jgi:N-acyl-D-amino-acid deacylase
MLSWSTESLLVDGGAHSTIRQGITTEILGEGSSMGPLSPEMKQRLLDGQGDLRYDITWTTLGEYLRELERLGVSTNVASFIGAGTVREHVVGLVERAPTPAELERMRELVQREMEDGALGIGSALIYTPGAYASTDELIELCRVAARYRGKYISHLRSEGDRLLEAVDELLRVSREAGLPAEIYHLKAAGANNWSKMDAVLAKIEGARRAGLAITADMYLYAAGATGLDAAIPPSALDGGFDALLARLASAKMRAQIAAAIRTPSEAWENLYLAAGSPDRVLLVGFRSDALRPLVGRTLGTIAASRGRDPVDALLDLVAEDRGNPNAVYFMMSEDNIRKQLRRPWVSIGSDAASIAPWGVFARNSTHPRAYGNVARLLGTYVRDERVITLPDAIRRLTGLPATNLGLVGRGVLRPGAFADVTIFDPRTIADRATFEQPHQFSVGVRHVLVNGVPVLRDGEHTGAKPGRALWGPGKTTIDGARGLGRPGLAAEPWPRSRIVSIVPPREPEASASPVP